MFLGHFGVGFAAKRAAPRVSLGTLFLAAQFIDLLWPTLLLLGLERVRIAPGITAVTPLDFEWYPLSHSLLAVAGWGLLIGVLYFALRRELRGAAVLAAAVVSHWLLDLLVHRPDLPLSPFGSARVGLGLWNSVSATVLVETVLLGAGVCLYTRTTQPRDAAGRFGLYGLVVFLALVYAANLLGPPPPSVTAIAWAGQLQWLLVVWAYWTDAHRVTRISA
jgi:membrane-bound metal-dependent hydrolase YbcI (DUF457 family)